LAACTPEVAYDPVADAGDDAVVGVGVLAQVDGSASFDPDGSVDLYEWTVLSAPEASTATLQVDGPRAGVTTDVEGSWTLGLTVVDDAGNRSLMDVAVIHAQSSGLAPTARLVAGGALGVGAQTLLDAGSSFDPEGAPLTYAFEVVIAPSSATWSLEQQADSPLATWVPDTEGFYILGVTVDDGTGPSTRADVELQVTTGVNRAPLADCGSPQHVEVDETATLDGTQSSDPDGDDLTWAWVLTQAPVDSESELDDPSSASPTLVPDLDGVWYAELRVHDGGLSSEVCQTTVTAGDPPGNNAPVADAGADALGQVDVAVTVDSSGSYDPDGDDLTTSWTFVSTPTDSSVTDGSLVASGSEASFTPDVAGFYVLQVEVCDAEPLCATDAVTVQVGNGGNQAPTADAGPDQTPSFGDSVVLDGRGSSDPENDPLTWSWTVLTTPANSGLTDADITDADQPLASVSPDAEGAYSFQLEVCDAGACDIDSVVIDVGGSGNTAPIADAGNDASATVGDTVAVDGSNSSDPEGDPLTHRWVFGSKPAASALVYTDIVDRKTAKASFVPDVAGTYVLRLTVDDGALNDADTVVVTVTGVANGAPTANAGADIEVSLGNTATLDGSGSTDPDGDPLLYRWVFNNLPSGSALTYTDISDRKTATPSFTPDVEGVFTLRLKVDDGTDTDTDTMTVTATPSNTAPVADAGTDVSGCTLDTVTLDGSGSSDADGDSFTHRWVFNSVPSGSALTYTDISDRKTATPSFTPDVSGTYVLRLKVDDGTDTHTDTVRVEFDQDDAVIVLHLDETSGTTLADDASGLSVSADNGEWVGAAFFGGLSFDAERITVPDGTETDLAKDFTVSWWMQAIPGETAYQAILMKGSSFTAYSLFRYGDEGFYFYGITTANTVVSGFYTGANHDGDFHHYALTMDASNVLTMYEDGASLGTLSATAAIATNNDDLTLGGYPSSAFYELDGTLDEVIVRDRALTSTEVANEAASTTQFCTGDSDTTAPSVSITTSTATTDQAYAAVEGTTSDASAVVSVSVDGVDALSTSGNFDTWVAFVPLSSGSNSVTAEAEDFWGNTATSSSVSFTYDDDCYDDYTLFQAFDDDGDGTAWDYSPRLNDGTESGVDRVIGVYGNAAAFDGNSSIIVPDAGNLDLTGRFTLDFWYASDATSDTEVIAYKGLVNTNYAVLVDGDDIYCAMVDGNGTQQLLTGEGFNDGDWHHVTCSWNLSTWRMFIDGAKEDDLAVTSAPAANTSDLVMGIEDTTSSFGYNGLLDGFRIQKGTSVALNGANTLRNEGEVCQPSGNLASGATATASASASTNYGASQVIDGLTDEDDYSDETYWLLPQATTGYVDIDLGDIYGVTMVRFANTHHGPRYNRATEDYEILVSPTGAFTGEETTFDSGSGTLETDLLFHQTDATTPAAGQYIRFTVDTYHSLGGGLNELEVYGL
jgi:hypothetical protein